MSNFLTPANFGTAINCMDGRAQEPVLAWMKERFLLDYVDVLTAPGADGVLAGGPVGTIEGIRGGVEISVTRHESKVVAIVGHLDCLGNPVCREAHWGHIAEAVAVVSGWGYPVEVWGLWVDGELRVEVVTSPDVSPG